MRLQDLDALITPARVRNYSVLLIAGYVLGLAGWLATMHADVDPRGKPFGYDFITFYAQSVLALRGQAALAYVPWDILAVEQTVVPADKATFFWHYPPPFALITLPLALMPYKLAYASFVASTFALYLAVVRRISDHRWTLLLAVAFPAVFVNAFHGQNGFLNTAILGMGLLLLEEHGFAAGLILGLLVYKPHFGVLLPFVFLVTGNWRAFAGAALSAAVFVGASFAVFGPAPWVAFAANLTLVRHLLESGYLPWPKIPSWFVTLSYLGVPRLAAYALHAAIAVTLGALTLQAWRRPGPIELKRALTVLATLSVSPYLFDYDLVLLALPIAWLADYGRRNALPAGTKAALALAFITPIVFATIAAITHLQFMPVALLAFFVAVWRCTLAAEAVDMIPGGAIAPEFAGAD
jgi:hypothetical protein